MERRANQETAQADWGDWIALRLVRGVGNVTYRQLLDRFTSPREIFTDIARPCSPRRVSARVLPRGLPRLTNGKKSKPNWST